MFEEGVILFRTPFGVFTDESCIKPRPTSLTRYLVISKPAAEVRPSYKCKLLASLHRKQRAIIEEVELAIDLKSECEILAFSDPGNSSVPANDRRMILSSRGRKIRPGSKKAQICLKKEIDEVRFKVLSLVEEKGRAEGRLQRMKKERMGLEEMNRDMFQRVEALNNERRRLQQFKITLIEKRHRLSQLRSDVFVRKKQLISELSVIYPLTLIDSVKRYSINGVQLPESDLQGYEGGGQASVALGYTAHLVSMLCFFLGIPLRYPIRHFGSRSRILDHITANIPEREREFPLYFKGKPDIFSIYGAYLLNKNIAQIRWYCGLVTQDLRSTLPNLASLIHNKLAIKGWDQNYDDDSLEMAQELTEETDRILFRSEISISLDQGLDQIEIRKSVDKGQQGNLSGSATNIDHTANNSVAVGDVVRGRAQERFLTGWKKGGITQPEDIDPAWLVNSMDADSDCGRRLSTCLNSRPYHSDLESSLPSNASEPSRSRRRSRRVGQVSLPTQFPNAHHAYNIPPHGSSAASAANGSIGIATSNAIPDGSIQAKQLRLLDRKISMYFGERSSSVPRSPTVRKTRSYEKLECDSSVSVALLPQNLSLFSPPQTIDSLRETNASNLYVDPTPTVTTISDIETDNCDFHVNPPIEIPTSTNASVDPEKSEEDATTSNENSVIKTPDSELPSSSTVVFNPSTSQDANDDTDTLSASNVELTLEQPMSKFLNEHATKDNKECNVIEPESDPNSKGFADDDGDDDDDPIARLLEESEPDKGLDDESDLWNRMEALSSYQSFNLIRKSTIDPNK
ncbi:unnamed protein product [Orchesella dallaii]|uniref:UV radiation resistance-associated gene protein n=1 Tax=Orchesella dallaii TaxID=48710 RepID=A0ABP1S9W4_9HEXA